MTGAEAHGPEGPGPEVVVLGIAQDGGHPQAGCTKACCARAFDDPRRAHHVASLAIVDGDDVWILDATPDFAAQLHEVTADSGRHLAGVLLTHAHIGHYVGLVDLGREVMGADHVPVYAMPRMTELLTTSEPWASLTRYGHAELRPLADGEPVALSDRITVTPFRVPHRDELSETVGFRVAGPERTVAWLPDIDKWELWDTSLEDFVAGVDRVYVDATFYADGELSRDMSTIKHPFIAETIARLADDPATERAKVRFVHLNHTNPALDPKSAASRAVRDAGMAVAREGERYPL